MFWTIIILIVALVGTNIAWIWYINQYDFVTETTALDGNGTNNYIGNSNLYFNNNYVIINLTLVYPLVNRNCQLLSIFHFLTVSFYFFVDK